MTDVLELLAPLSGQTLLLTQVPDPVFAGLVMGDGLAIAPTSNLLLAPCAGVIRQIARTGHALTLIADNGAEILMHIGIDTVSLKGEGFCSKVRQGQRVARGAPLIEVDFAAIRPKVPSLITMLVIANSDHFILRARASGAVEAGVSFFLSLEPCADASASGVLPDALGEVSGEARVAHGDGLHARPAALIQAAAKRFNARVWLEFDGKQASARSVVALMELGVGARARVRVSAHGVEAVAALAAVIAAVETHSPSAQSAAAGEKIVASGLRAGALYGVCAAPGRVIGKVVQYSAAEPRVQVSCGDAHFEFNSLARALADVRCAIAAQMHAALRHGDGQMQSIFDAHLALLDDPELISSAEREIGAGQSAGMAFRSAARAQVRRLSTLNNPLLAERVNDLRDLERRVLQAISGEESALPTLYPQSILIADDLTPSDLTRLPHESLAGVVLARGGATSHVAILARARGIPAMVAAGPAVLGLVQGLEVVLDASAGWLDPHPDALLLTSVRSAIDQRSAMLARVRAEAHLVARTLDGAVIEVVANIASQADAQHAREQGADGVGLLRSEFLFIDRAQAPTVSEQSAAYQSVLDALGGKSVIMRTLDVGGDKELPYLKFPQEPNPALGLRGIRSGFAYPALLDDQLAALLAVRPLGALRILLPMVADVSELLRVKQRLRQLADAAQLPQVPQLGVMIEIPSAALLADQLASHADFLSIGTNDLTQYTLAMDRCNPELASALDPLHPALLRLMALCVEGASRHRRWVGVCGAMASDLEAVPVLLGLGITELSVSPGLIPEIKARVRMLDLAHTRRETQPLLALTSAREVRARAREIWPQA